MPIVYYRKELRARSFCIKNKKNPPASEETDGLTHTPLKN